MMEVTTAYWDHNRKGQRYKFKMFNAHDDSY